MIKKTKKAVAVSAEGKNQRRLRSGTNKVGANIVAKRANKNTDIAKIDIANANIVNKQHIDLF